MDSVKWFAVSVVGWGTDVRELQRGTKNRWMEIKDHFLAYYWRQRGWKKCIGF